MLDVALVTCRDLPEPDPDRELLRDALVSRGLSAEWLAWDDPAARWDEVRVAVLRSTWNYPTKPEEFRSWIDRVSAVVRLWNPPEVVRRNLHKGYLLDVAAAGVPVVPTRLLERGARETLAGTMCAEGWEDVVVKPAVSAGSFRTLRVREDNPSQGEAHLKGLLAERDVLVQPYLRSVEEHGERSLIRIDGELTHSIRKNPRFAGEDESVSEALPIADDERALAERVLSTVEHDLLYARVDVAPGEDGSFVLMELELVEPSLFLAEHPPALARLADAIRRRIGS